MNLKERIKEGLEGKFEGLANGFDRINNYIFGVQRKCITLIGGQSGVYKSTMLDFIIQNAIQDAEAKNIKLNLFYNSFEIDKLTKQCNWLSTQIYLKYGIIISPETIKGFGKNRLTLEQEKIVDFEVPLMEELFNKIHWNFAPLNPTGLYRQVWNHFYTDELKSRGYFLEEDYIDPEDGKIKKKKVKFILDDPNEVNLMCTDHFYLVKKERGYNTKENIDKFSEYQVETKNMFDMSYINLQQFNSGLSSVDRLKFKGADVSPQQSDFRDTTNPYTDSDLCIGLMSPFKMDLESCLGYDITKLKEKMIMFKVIKNRLAKDNIGIGLHVKPEAGSFHELPEVKSINYNNYLK